MPRGKINWIAVRTAYLVQGWSLAKCAEEFKIDPTTVKKRASAEGWHSQRHRNATNATEVASDEARQAVAQSRAEFQASLNRSIAGMFGLLRYGKEDIENAKPGRSRAETVKAVLESYKIASMIARDNAGLTPGQSSFSDSEDGRKRIIFAIDEPQSETA